MPGAREARYKEVRGLARGLSVLRALNVLSGQEIDVAAIAGVTGLHRTTVRRLLGTLMAGGYVRRSDSDDSFRLARDVRSLSEGFKDEDWIAEVGAKVLAELLVEVVWPSDITTPDGDAMVVRETTHRFSRLSFHRAMVGVRLPMLLTASGRAYLAFCPDTERQHILRLAGSGDVVPEAAAVSLRQVSAMLRRTRQAGFATNEREWAQQRNVAAIAVPVFLDGRIMGCMNMIYHADAMSLDEAIRRYVVPLKAASGRINALMAERGVSSWQASGK